MQGFVLRLLIIIIGLWLASAVLPGVTIDGTGTFILAALLLGFVNAVVRPLAVILTLPLTLLTMGLFLLVINAGMFGLVARFLDGFSVAGFWSALFGSIIVSITSTWASWYIGANGRYEILIIEKRR
jgi:putative membrane protein